MLRRIRWRKVCKWAGTLVSVALLAVFVTSGYRLVGIEGEVGKFFYDVVAVEGRLGIEFGWIVIYFDVAPHWLHVTLPKLSFGAEKMGWPEYNFPMSMQIEDGSNLSADIDLPLQLLLAATIVPTALLWYLDRRRHRPGHCRRCGYSLTANTSGICPECGQRVPAAPAAAPE